MRSQQISSRLSLLVSLLFIINLSVFMWSTIPVHASSQNNTVAKMQPDLSFQKDLDVLSKKSENSDGYFASGSFGHCNWQIIDGTLTISPKDGIDGQLGKCDLFGGPWNNPEYNPIKITKVVIEQGVKANTDSSCLFAGLKDVTEIMGLENLDTSQVTNMSDMFSNCFSLTKLGLSNFDTSQVTNMSDMFFNCSSLTKLDFGSKFDTSKVIDMSGMFEFCSKLTNLDLSNFDTSQVKDMWEMFTGTKSLWQIIMGEKFKIKDGDNTYLQAPSKPTTFKDGKDYISSGGGYWQAVQGGTVHDPKGVPFRSDAFPTERKNGGKETYVWEHHKVAPVIKKIDKDSSVSKVKYPYVEDYRNTGSLPNFTISGSVSDSDSKTCSIYYAIDEGDKKFAGNSVNIDSSKESTFTVTINEKEDLETLAMPKKGGHEIQIYAKDSDSAFSDPKQCLIAENGIIDFQYLGPNKEEIKNPQTLVRIVNTEHVGEDDQHYKVYKVSDYLPQDIWTSSTRYSLLQIPSKLETLINKNTGQIPSTAGNDQGFLPVQLNYNENGRVSLTEVPQLDFGDVLLPTHKKPVPIKKQSGKLEITDTTGAPRWELTMEATPFYRVDPQSGKEIKDDKNKLDNLLIYHYANNTNKNITSDPPASVLISSYRDHEVQATTQGGITNFQNIWWNGEQQIEGPMLLPPKNYSFKNKAHQVKYQSTVTWTLNNSL